jgi:gluconokinase
VTPSEVIVGLDVGTTGVKAVAFGVGTSWRRVAIREYPLLHPAPGQEVQDPEAIVAATTDALAECVAGLEPLAISLSAAMHGLIALDGDKQPLTPLITWADSRAREQAAQLRASGQARELHRRSGTPVHPMTPLTKLLWFAQHEPETFAAARFWVGLKDYVLYRLTGQLVTELSTASATGLLDLTTRTWSPEALALTGIDAAQLPPIRASTDTLASDSGVPVVTGAADGPLGNLGTGALAPGVAGLSLGTSGAIRMVVDEPQVDEHGTLFCYALTDTAWVVGGAISNGGVVVRWAGSALAPDLEGDEALLELAATAPAGCDGLVMLPYLLAERAPLWDPNLPGAYLGLRRDHTRAHLIRAAVEGVCLQLKVVLDQLDRLHPVESVRVTGGTFRSPLWRDVMAASLERPLSVVGEAEGTALGAAALGLFALGRAPTLEAALEQLSDPDAAAPERIDADPELVDTYRSQRAAVPELIGALGAVAGLFD